MFDAGARDAQRRARHRGKPDQRADLDMVGLDRIASQRRASPARARSWCWCRCPRCWRRARPENARVPAHAARRRRCANRWCRGPPTAATSAFSVAVTLGSSRKTSAPFRRVARNSSRWFAVTVAPSCSKARKCVSSRRRPITSPPGGGSITSPQRASSGPASRIEARIRAHSSGSRSAARISLAWIGSVLRASIRLTRRPTGSVPPAFRCRECAAHFPASPDARSATPRR